MTLTPGPILPPTAKASIVTKWCVSFRSIFTIITRFVMWWWWRGWGGVRVSFPLIYTNGTWMYTSSCNLLFHSIWFFRSIHLDLVQSISALYSISLCGLPMFYWSIHIGHFTLVSLGTCTCFCAAHGIAGSVHFASFYTLHTAEEHGLGSHPQLCDSQQFFVPQFSQSIKWRGLCTLPGVVVCKMGSSS